MTVKQLKAYAVAILGLVGVVSITLYTGTVDVKNRTVTPIVVDGQTITFTYTDKIGDEDLVIISDRAEYTNGFSHAIIYLAVANISAVTQEVELLGYFRDNKKRLRDIAILTDVTQEFNTPVTTENCVELASGTTCTTAQTSTTTEQYRTGRWVPLPIITRNTVEALKESGLLAGVSRESAREFISERKTIAFPIKPGEVLYYKVEIEFPPQGRYEVYFEAIGSAGGYGFLK